MSIDHSTSSPNFHSEELLSALEPTMFKWRDRESTIDHNNGSSTVFQRPSRTTTGSLTHLISNPMEDQATSDALLQTQDGGNYSDKMEHSLQTLRTRRLLQFQVVLTMKTEISWLKIRMERFINNGR
jgi:hypothetical protein